MNVKNEQPDDTADIGEALVAALGFEPASTKKVGKSSRSSGKSSSSESSDGANHKANGNGSSSNGSANGSDKNGSDTSGSGTAVVNKESSENEGPDTKSTDTESPDAKSTEANSIETDSLKTKSPDAELPSKSDVVDESVKTDTKADEATTGSNRNRSKHSRRKRRGKEAKKVGSDATPDNTKVDKADTEVAKTTTSSGSETKINSANKIEDPDVTQPIDQVTAPPSNSAVVPEIEDTVKVDPVGASAGLDATEELAVAAMAPPVAETVIDEPNVDADVKTNVARSEVKVQSTPDLDDVAVEAKALPDPAVTGSQPTVKAEQPPTVPADTGARADRRQAPGFDLSNFSFGRRQKVQARKVRRVVRHIDPWSVLTFSVLFHLCLFAALLLASVLVWNAAEAAGTIQNMEELIKDLGDYETFTIDGQEVFTAGVALAGVLTLASSVLLVLLTVVFNLISDLVGGIRITVIEEETVRVKRKKRSATKR